MITELSHVECKAPLQGIRRLVPQTLSYGWHLGAGKSLYSGGWMRVTPLPSACRFGKLKLGSLPQLSFTSMAISRYEDGAEDHSFEYNWINGIESLEKYNPKG